MSLIWNPDTDPKDKADDLAALFLVVAWTVIFAWLV